jgi:hypothetical protein
MRTNAVDDAKYQSRMHRRRIDRGADERAGVPIDQRLGQPTAILLLAWHFLQNRWAGACAADNWDTSSDRLSWARIGKSAVLAVTHGRTSNSQSKPSARYRSPPHSLSSRKRSDTGIHPDLSMPSIS